MTPSSSSSVSEFKIPWVTATAACSGSRPVAKALAPELGTMYTPGVGIFARCESLSTMR